MEEKKDNAQKNGESKDKIKKESDTKKDEGVSTSAAETYGDGFPQDDSSPGTAHINVSDTSRPFDSGTNLPRHQTQEKR